MYLNPESMDKTFKQSNTHKVQPINNGPSFQNVLNNTVYYAALEGASVAANKNMKKRKKDTKEILDDYEEGMDDLYDVLEMQSKIRRVFRKIRLESEQ